MDFRELIIWIILGLLLIWFFNSSSVTQIILGVLILSLLLIRNFREKKVKNSKWNRASNETFFDTMKWFIFGVFVIIYPTFLKNDIIALLITCLIFVLILFGLNLLKEKNSLMR